MDTPIAAVAVLLAGTFLSPGLACAQSHKEIVPGDVVLQQGGGITGAFRVRESAAGIVSPGSGGACLVFSKHAKGGPACSDDSDCALDPALTEGHAYCLHRDGHPEGKGKCWVRAGDFCLRSPEAPYALDTDIEFPRDAAGAVQPVPNPTPGWWRVLACLNGSPGACGGAGGEVMLRAGTPRKIP